MRRVRSWVHIQWYLHTYTNAHCNNLQHQKNKHIHQCCQWVEMLRFRSCSHTVVFTYIYVSTLQHNTTHCNTWQHTYTSALPMDGNAASSWLSSHTVVSKDAREWGMYHYGAWAAGSQVCCSVLQCVAVCCGVLRCIVVCCSGAYTTLLPLLRARRCVAVCCGVLCVAVCCGVLAVGSHLCCSVLQCVECAAVRCRIL